MQKDRSFREGDIICCWSKDPVSVFISLKTSWPFGAKELRYAPSHVAMIGDYNGALGWYESTTKCKRKCLEAGKKASGFQVHEPNKRVADYLGSGGAIAVYRMSSFARMSFDEICFRRLLNLALDSKLAYSMGLLDGAMFSGTRLLKFSWLYSLLVPGVDEQDVFCSEIVSRLMQELGLQNRVDPRRYTPGGVMRDLTSNGAYKLIHKQWG